MFKKLKARLNKGSERSIIVKKNIFLSLLLKGASILLSLLIVPLTINYVNPSQYGFWLTISSIVAWVSYFDLGLGQGLRNRYAESKALGHYDMMSKYISTTYALMIIIFTSVFVVFAFCNMFIDWVALLNISNVTNETCRSLMFILVGFFCLNMVFKVTNFVLLGDQQTAFSSLIIVIEQILSLFFIFVLSKVAESNLLYLATITAGVPVLVLFIITCLVYTSKGSLRKCRPSFKNIDFKLSRSLLGLGIKFFLIQLSLLLIFQIVNIIISRNCGQDMVAQYQLSYKYFSMMYMLTTIIMTPYWSAFTDAYTKCDFIWMKATYKKLNKMLFLCVPILLLMIALSPIFFKIWINNSVTIPLQLHICMMFYVFAMIYASIRMYILNGLGKVTLQFIVYMIFAIVSIPMMNHLSHVIGVYGILLFLSLVYLTQGVIGSIQIKKLLNKNSNGIWNK
jgi:O-antigen/teichoic acid export membrane protein